jgi:uncharacterized membrane protein (DUF106 family)
VELFNKGVTGLFDLLLRPLSFLGPFWSLAVFSVVTGILMLWVYGRISNQDAIREIRDRIRGNLIAVRLFGDDLGLMFRLQGRLIRDNAVALKHVAIPLLVLFVPLVLIVIQLNLRYGAIPLEPGRAALIKVTMRNTAAIGNGVTLEAPRGVEVETRAVRIVSLREVAWRIRAQEAGDYRLVVHVGDEPVEKQLRVGDGWGPVSTLRTGKGFLDVLLYPGEPPIRSETVESIEIRHEPLDIGLFGLSIHWLVLFFVLSVLSGFAFRRVLGVEL